MRNVNLTILPGPDYEQEQSIQIDANQLIAASFHIFFGDTSASGTVTINASNDVAPARNMVAEDGFTVTNWAPIPSATATISSGAPALISVNPCAFRWLQAVWVPSTTGVQNIITVADMGGSLNSAYFLLQDEGSTNLYYVWFNVNSAGVDPMIAGRTGVEISIATNATANTIATDLGTAIALLNSGNSFTTSVNNNDCNVTNVTAGTYVPMSDGTHATHFTFIISGGGTSTITINMNAQSF